MKSLFVASDCCVNGCVVLVRWHTDEHNTSAQHKKQICIRRTIRYEGYVNTMGTGAR